jgi:hypothetical protein
MPLVVEQDVAPDPGHIRVLGTDRVVFEAQGVTDLIEELFGSWFHLASPNLTSFDFCPIMPGERGHHGHSAESVLGAIAIIPEDFRKCNPLGKFRRIPSKTPKW